LTFGGEYLRNKYVIFETSLCLQQVNAKGSQATLTLSDA
jgi:hypothetical protein